MSYYALIFYSVNLSISTTNQLLTLTDQNRQQISKPVITIPY